MENKRAVQDLMEEKLVAIFRGVPTEKAADVAKALKEGGVKFFEVCFNQSSQDIKEEFKKQFEAVKQAVGEDGYVGAGTVLTVEQVDFVKEMGGEIIVSPCTDENIIRRAKELEMICIPGAMTPTEIQNAYAAGADVVKMYVVEDPHYVQMLKGPLGHIPLQITCNVSTDTIPEFMKAGVKAFGTKAMLPDAMVKAGDYAGIREKARQFVEAIRKAS